MSGGPSTIQQSSRLPAWAASFAKEFLGEGAAVANSQSAYPQGLNYQVAGLTPDQQAALSQIEGQTGSATGIANMGAGQIGQTLSGDYLSPNSNPWLSQTAQAATQGLVNQYNTATAPGLMAEGLTAGGGGPGSLGDSSAFLQQQAANQYGLGTNIGNTEASIYGTNYTNERANQVSELGLLPQTQSSLYAPANNLLGAGTIEQTQAQNVLNANQQNAAQQNQYPWSVLGNFGNLFSQLTGGFSIGSSTNPNATKIVKWIDDENRDVPLDSMAEFLMESIYV